MITKLIVGDDIKVHDYAEDLRGYFLDFTRNSYDQRTLQELDDDVLELFSKLYKRDLNDLVCGLSVAEQNVIYLLDDIYLSNTVVVNNVELGMNPAKHQQWVKLFMGFCESKGVTNLYMTTCSNYICSMFYDENIIRL